MNCLTEKTYRAGAYIRLSVEDENKENESISIVNQRLYIKNFASTNGIEIYDYYVDDGFTGGDFDRPGFKKMIEDIEKGIIDCVITKDMSRLGREFIETGNYVFKYFPEHNIRYIAINDNYDTLKPNGMEDILPFKAVLNDAYLRDISRKVKSIRHEKMKNGLYVGSSVPYGYKRSPEDNRKFVIDEYSSKIVKRIFELKDSGKTNSMIARTLTNEGILPPDVYSGKKQKGETITANLWKPGTIGTILSNEVYIGNLIQRKYERVSLKSKKKRLLPRSKWIITTGAVPPIISNELFTSVNSVTKRDGTRFKKYDYLLKGLVVCPDCGKPMMVRRIKSKANPENVSTIYICRTYANFRNGVCSMHYYREDKLNELVLKEIRNILINYSDKNQLDKQYETSICKFNILDEYESQLKVLKNKVVTIDKAISQLYKDKVMNIISESDFFNIKKEFEEDKKESENKIVILEETIRKTKNMFTDNSAKQKYVNDFLKCENPSKEMIKTIVDKIEVYEDKTVKIYFTFNVNEVNNV